MKSLKTRLSALAMLIILLVVTVLPSFAATQPAKYSSTYNSGQRGVECTTLDGTTAAGYYTGSYSYDTLSKQSATSLLQSLRTLMTTGHKTSSYDDCRDYAKNTDCENGDGRVSLIYTGYSATMSQYNGWNREHVWPKSLGGKTTSGGGADLHHIRPSDAVVNSTRGSNKYGNVNNGKAVYGSNPASDVLGGYSGGGYFEPLDSVKGDVARICLYVWVRWGSAWGAESVTEVFQSVDVLLEWCELDPVDTWEMGRNEVVYALQGNRNVFIDYPEYAWLLFGESVPEGMTTPSGKASNGTTGGGTTGGGTTGGGSTGGDTTCAHTTTTVVGKVDATCGKTGYTGDTYCEECNEKLSSGSTVPATGNHRWGEWETNASGNTATRECSVCSKTEQKEVGSTVPSKCTHKNVETRGYVPQCSEGAYSGDEYCVDCGVLVLKGTSLQTLPHEYKDGNVVVAPTDDADGLQEQECIYCGELNVVRIPRGNSANSGNNQTTVVVVAASVGGVSVLTVLFFILKRKFF